MRSSSSSRRRWFATATMLGCRQKRFGPKRHKAAGRRRLIRAVFCYEWLCLSHRPPSRGARRSRRHGANTGVQTTGANTRVIVRAGQPLGSFSVTVTSACDSTTPSVADALQRFSVAIFSFNVDPVDTPAAVPDPMRGSVRLPKVPIRASSGQGCHAAFGQTKNFFAVSGVPFSRSP